MEERPRQHRHSMSVSSLMDVDTDFPTSTSTGIGTGTGTGTYTGHAQAKAASGARTPTATGPAQATGWPSLPPPPSLKRKSPSPSIDSSAPSTVDSLFSKQAPGTQTPSYASGLSVDDPDVRLAAEALEDLRASGGDHVVAPQFLDRVSTYPIVSSAVRAYEQGKHTSRGFRYGADMFESVARPVVKRFEPLDEFACRQLDRIEGRYGLHHDLETGSPASAQQEADTVAPPDRAQPLGPPKQHAPIPRWQSVLAGASGLTASLSEESIKSLRYCVEWLHYANAHLAHLASMLRQYTSRASHSGPYTALTAAERKDVSTTVATVKREIVGTLKKVFEIVSRYATLPEPARGAVRVALLGLPQRWAARQEETSASSPTQQSHVTDQNDGAGDARTQAEAARVHSLANESIEMLQSVTEAVSRTLASSEGWSSKWRTPSRQEQSSLQGAEGVQEQGRGQAVMATRTEDEEMVDLPLPRVPLPTLQTSGGH